MIAFILPNENGKFKLFRDPHLGRDTLYADPWSIRSKPLNRLTTNGMCVKNSTFMQMARTSNNRVNMACTSTDWW